MATENDLDQLFKQGLEDPEIPFNELDWEKMERKLDGQAKRKIIPVWLMRASGIAAALTIFMWWIFSAPVEEKDQVTQLPVEHQLRNTERPVLPNGATGNLENKRVKDTDQRELGFQWTKPNTGNGSGSSAGYGELASNSIQETGPFLPVVKSPMQLSLSPSTTWILKMTLISSAMNRQKSRPQTADEMLAQKANALANSKDPFEKISTAEVAGSVQQNMDKSLQQQPSLIISAMAAPDITSAASRKPAKVSSNLGMLATYALGSRFSVTSGAIYAKKYYNSGGMVPDGVYATDTNLGWEVKAVCNVLDIPLTINYKVLSRKKLSVSVNSGLSSYIMLKEKYEYITERPGNVEDISTLELTNQNKHLFGVANVSVSVDHQLSDHLSIGVQPFMKLPLTGIGNGNVNLKSTGVSFSLNIGLFPAKRTGKFAANRYSSLY